MGVGIGLVGLPNVGKSTLFNALTRAQQAESANYPFCTIEPNKAVVPVPDSRLDTIAQMAQSVKKIHATVEFVDIAGLVKGASQGEGLGNKFLSNISFKACSYNGFHYCRIKQLLCLVYLVSPWNPCGMVMSYEFMVFINRSYDITFINLHMINVIK